MRRESFFHAVPENGSGLGAVLRPRCVLAAIDWGRRNGLGRTTRQEVPPAQTALASSGRLLAPFRYWPGVKELRALFPWVHYGRWAIPYERMERQSRRESQDYTGGRGNRQSSRSRDPG